MEKPVNKKRKYATEKGVVTPPEIAVLVDRYLSDNNFSQAQSTFRTEAASVFPRFSVPETSNTLMSLPAIFGDYIRLKEQRHIVEQEMVHLDQEKARVNIFLQGMHNLMRSFNSFSTTIYPNHTKQMVVNFKSMANGLPLDHSQTGRGAQPSSERRPSSTQPQTKKSVAAGGGEVVPEGTVVRKTGISKRVTPPTPSDAPPASAVAVAVAPPDDVFPLHPITSATDGDYSGPEFDLDFLDMETLGDDFFVMELLNEIDPCYNPLPCDADLFGPPGGDFCSRPCENVEAENGARISEDDKTGEICSGSEGSSPTA